jgi:YidC/Oxa1 family membrane protein insertase
MFRFIFEFREMRRFQKLDWSERNLVFYAESESYWGYLYPFIQHLVEKHGKSVSYLTSSPSDPVLEGKIPGIRPFCIGKGAIRTILFASLEADVMVMTLPDFGKSYIKRSKFPVHYVFVPHNMNSTHMVFNKGAHDAFDTIFCVGPHQLAELREAEGLYDLPPRTLVENGYVRLDTLHDEVERRGSSSSPTLKRQVFIAPSWPPHSLLEIVGVDLIEVLLSVGYAVVVRPHRDTQRVHFDALRNRFGEDQNFILAEGKQGLDAFYTSDLLITDWSGSAFSFAFARERPVLFIDVPRKVLNPEYERFSHPPLETIIREKIGAVLKPEHINEAPELVETLCRRSDEWAETIRAQREQWIYNLGNSAQLGAAYLAKLARESRIHQQ